MRIYFIKIDDDSPDCGIDAISLVEVPAVQKNFLCFNEEKPMQMNFRDETQHIITGVLCLADTPIYRNDERFGEYYVVFTKDTIQKMVERFAKSDLFRSVNLQHKDDSFVDGIYMFESYIVNKERGICPAEFADIPDGSWVGSYKVENPTLWEEIVNGNELNGFSLQGFFRLDEKFSEAKKETPDFDSWIEKFL